MIGMVLRLDVPSVVGLLVFAGCCFAAGWVARRDYMIWLLLSPGGRRRQWRRSQRLAERSGRRVGRNPW